MIDLHCHILPGVDDGAADWDTAIAMATMAAADGIQTIVVTPHAFDGTPELAREQRDTLLGQLAGALKARGVAIDLVPGFECRIRDGLVPMLRAKPWFRLGVGTAFLLELPWEMLVPGLDQLLFEACAFGLTPVIAHADRYEAVQRRPDLVRAWVEAGASIQVTAGCLLGQFGTSAQKTASRLIKNGLAHVLASDAHNAQQRAPVLSQALSVARRLVGAAADELVTRNPASLLGIGGDCSRHG